MLKGIISGGLIITFMLLFANKAKGSASEDTSSGNAGSGDSSEGGRNKRIFRFPNGNGADRHCDPGGCGHFGASRGSRLHKGHDFLADPGQDIVSPIYGRVTRHGYPYRGDSYYRLVEIRGEGIHEGYLVKIFYVTPKIAPGNNVVPGQKIGIAQDVAAKYPNSQMQPHIHFELYVGGKAVDPRPFFEAAA